MRRFVAIALVAVLLPVGVVAADSGKFTFADVTFPDGTTGEIEAGSKVKKNFTSCSYFSDDYRDYLGYFQSAEFASDDAAEVLAFCLDHYDERDVH